MSLFYRKWSGLLFLALIALTLTSRSLVCNNISPIHSFSQVSPECQANTPSPKRSKSCASTTVKLPNTPMPSGTSYTLPMALTSVANNVSGSSFLTRAYPTMKHHNPHTPILIREAMGFEPRVIARYEFGREQAEDLKGKSICNSGREWELTWGKGLDGKAIEDKITALVKGQ